MSKTVIFILFLACWAFYPLHSQLLIGIAGGSGSGKTYFAAKLREIFGNQILVLEQDNYYKDFSHIPFDERHKINFDAPDAIDFDLLQQHLTQLKAGLPIQQPLFDFISHTRLPGTVLQSPAKVIIVEGFLLFVLKEIRDLLDWKIYIEADADIRLLRMIYRDLVERGNTIDYFKQNYVPYIKQMHDLYVEPTKKYADLIVPNQERSDRALDILSSAIRLYLR